MDSIIFCGGICAGNNIRIGWEEDLFGDAYHDATAFERCKYGALNVTGCDGDLGHGMSTGCWDGTGPCPR